MLLRNASIGIKLLVLIITSVVFLAVIGGTGFYYTNQMNASSEEMYNEALLPLKWQSRINTNNRAIDSYLLELLINSDFKTQQQLKEEIMNKKIENDSLAELLEKSLLSDLEIEKLAEYKEEYQIYLTGLEEIYALVSEGKAGLGYTKYQEEVTISRANANSVMTEIGDYLETYADELATIITDSNKSSTNVMIIVIILVVIVNLLLGATITRMIVNPVKEMKGLMADAENGDLTVEGKYSSKDEIGMLTDSFNSMMHRLRELMRQVHNTSEQVSASSEELTASAEQSSKASEEIASTIQEVATGAEHQVSRVEEGTKVVAEMTQNVQHINTNTYELSLNATEAAQKAREGNVSIQSTIEQMNSINTAVTQLSHVVKGLGKRSEEIGNIVEVITDIASQTNLLALNAAIEAARAGEHGRGFAVVADEVRKLAVQSTDSAQNVIHLIEIIQDETHAAVQSMETTAYEVTEGIGAVHKAGQSFASIQSSIEEVSKQIQDVSAAAEQLSIGSEQVLRSEKELAEIAEDAAFGSQNVAASIEEQLASMEEISASADSLAQMAEELQLQIRRFKV